MPQRGDAWRFGALAVALSAATALVTVAVGPNWLAFALFPLSVAFYAATGQDGRAATLVGCSGLAVGAALGSSLAGFYYAIATASGVVMGVGIRRGWPYGRVAAWVSAYGAAVFLGHASLTWATWKAVGVASLEALQATLREAATAPSQAETTARQLAILDFLKENWTSLGPGLTVAFVMAAACAGVSLVAWWLRVRGTGVGITGSFTRMKPPDWLAWAVIAAFFGWFADQRWPHPVLRAASWNAAIVLMMAYWLNGIAIVGYTVVAMRRSLLLLLAAALVVTSPATQSVLPFLGLFDTWADFRRRIDELTKRRARLKGDGGANDSQGP
ncbi:MAG TPA: DUF2232 domain-containing protein [Candidatus Hydrogenedentes bacterium]|nr:DUF2232 domain-containing protein [Candidatus Hydrogenedentota bacterium]HOS02869.1 DUF2232 domain-containing protein [Candidatus Hydrogenedentota bacterium]